MVIITVSADAATIASVDDPTYMVERPAAVPPYQEIQLGAAIYAVDDRGAEIRLGDLPLQRLAEASLPIGFVKASSSGLERTWRIATDQQASRAVGLRPDKLAEAIRQLHRDGGHLPMRAARFRLDVTLWEFLLAGPRARQRRDLPPLGTGAGGPPAPLFVVFDQPVVLNGPTAGPPPPPPPQTTATAAPSPTLPPLRPRVAYEIRNWSAGDSLLCRIGQPNTSPIWQQSTPQTRLATTILCTFAIVADPAACDYAGADRSALLHLAVSGGAVERLGADTIGRLFDIRVCGHHGGQVGGQARSCAAMQVRCENTEQGTAHLAYLCSEGRHQLTLDLGSAVLDYDVARLFHDGTNVRPLTFTLTCRHPSGDRDQPAPVGTTFQIAFEPEDDDSARRIVMVAVEGAAAAIVVDIRDGAGGAGPQASTVSLEDVDVEAGARAGSATIRLRNLSSRAADIVWQAGNGTENSENLPAWSLSQAAQLRVLANVPADEIHALKLRFKVRVGQTGSSGSQWCTEVAVDIPKKQIVEIVGIDLGTSTISAAYLPHTLPTAVVVPLAAEVNTYDPSQPDAGYPELLSSQVGITNNDDGCAPPWLVAGGKPWSDLRLRELALDPDVRAATIAALLARLRQRRSQLEVHQPVTPAYPTGDRDTRFVVRGSAKMCVRHGHRLDGAAPDRDVWHDLPSQNLRSVPARFLESEVLLTECLDEIIRVLLPQAGPIPIPTATDPIPLPAQWLSHVLTGHDEHRRFEFVVTVPASTSAKALRRYECAAATVKARIASDQSGAADHVRFRFVHEAVAVAEAIRARYPHDVLWPAPAAMSPQPADVTRRLVVVDIGAGTLDVCLLDLAPADLQPNAPAPSARSSYAVELGGNALDEALARDVGSVLKAAQRGPQGGDFPGLHTLLESFETDIARSSALAGGPFDRAKRAMFEQRSTRLYLAGTGVGGGAPPRGAAVVYAVQGARVLAAGDPRQLWVELDFSDPAGYPTSAGHYIRAIGEVVVRGLGRAVERPTVPTYLTAVLTGRGALFAPIARAVRDGLDTWLRYDSKYRWGSMQSERQVHLLHELMGSRHDPTAMKTVVVEGATGLARADRIQINPNAGGNIALVEGDVDEGRFTAVRKITFPGADQIDGAAGHNGTGTYAFVPYGLDTAMLEALDPAFRNYMIRTCIDIVPQA